MKICFKYALKSPCMLAPILVINWSSKLYPAANAFENFDMFEWDCMAESCITKEADLTEVGLLSV